MNTQSPTTQSSASLKRLLGGILLLIGLLNGLTIIVPLAFLNSPSRIITALSLYIQCLPLLLICIGVHLLTDLKELRVSSLLSVALSPFLTWEHLGQGSWYMSVNSILCILCTLYTLQHIFRLNTQLNLQAFSSEATISTMPGRKQQATIAAMGYWLFFLSVFAPFIVRLIDFVSMSLHGYKLLLRTSDVWDMTDHNFNLIHNVSLALTLLLATMLYIIWTVSEYFVFRKSITTHGTAKEDTLPCTEDVSSIPKDASSCTEDGSSIPEDAPSCTENGSSIPEDAPPIS